ncbi:MAG: aminotransferase class V-fold PLP-dependent enzyme, partial [Planctomycetes bacterium]|nr:aminotransferase class V-fold PLP-dependent enzyme [Planctomycetota bacterium]
MNPSLYLDHAATSFPKPPTVSAAVQRWFETLGVSENRGDGSARTIVADVVADVRARLARRCGVPRERVAFCSGATEALHLTFSGLLQRGHRVLTTDLEHNAVARPLAARAANGEIELERIPVLPDGSLDLDVATARLREGRFDLLVFASASNVTGLVVDAGALVEAARQHGCRTICDASQSAGLLPLDFGADIVVASAHKSLLGPPGLGFLAARPDVELTPTKLGGTGSGMASDRHPADWPRGMEAGTPNTPAIFGLQASLDWIDERTEPSLLAHGLAWCDAFLDACSDVVETIALPPRDRRVPIVSLRSAEFDPAELGAMLAEQG